MLQWPVPWGVCLSYGKPGLAYELCKSKLASLLLFFFSLSVFQQLEEGRLSEFIVHT